MGKNTISSFLLGVAFALIISLIGLFVLGSFGKANKSTSPQETETIEIKITPTPKPAEPTVYTAGPFEDINGYGDGLIAVKDTESSLWGYIDKRGEYIIEPKYVYAFPFSEGLAAVLQDDGYYHFITTDGETAFDLDITGFYALSELGLFSGGYAYAEIENTDDEFAKPMSIINTSGKILKTVDYSDFEKMNLHINGEILYSENAQLYDRLLNEITIDYSLPGDAQLACPKDISHVNLSSNYINVYDENSDFYIIVNKEGQVLFDVHTIIGKIGADSYDIKFNDDFVCITRDLDDTIECALFDYDGNIILDFEYSTIIPITTDTFVVYNRENEMAIIDAQANEIMSFSPNTKSSVDRFEDCIRAIYNGGVPMLLEKNGNKTAQFYNLKTTETEDSVLLFDSFPLHSFVYDQGLSKTIFYSSAVYDYKGNILFETSKEDFQNLGSFEYGQYGIMAYKQEDGCYLAMVVLE